MHFFISMMLTRAQLMIEIDKEVFYLGWNAMLLYYVGYRMLGFSNLNNIYRTNLN